MPHILKNQNLEVHIDLPEENYTGTRFDWSGQIQKVIFNRVTFGTQEEVVSEQQHLLGRGFYNEFGIDSPLGFEETAKGEWFHKIGVGELKKESYDYFFAHKYEVEPCDFTIHKDLYSIQYEHNSALLNGYGYRLKKKIELISDGFKLNYFLENTGKKPIQTSEYGHNFLAIDNQPMGKDYVLKFPFDLDSDTFQENVNPENCIHFNNEELGFAQTPKEVFFFSYLNGTKPIKASWKLENKALNMGIEEAGDFTTSKINLWGLRHVISPELFFDIDLEAGESVSWSRKYHFYRLQL